MFARCKWTVGTIGLGGSPPPPVLQTVGPHLHLFDRRGLRIHGHLPQRDVLLRPRLRTIPVGAVRKPSPRASKKGVVTNRAATVAQALFFCSGPMTFFPGDFLEMAIPNR